jgi:peptide/nickel transport system substrate-binding protein
MTYTFRLHEGVRFHDGSPLTSADVKATYERIADPPEDVLSAHKAWYADILSIDAPDPATVVFKLKAPSASILASFASPFACIYSAARLKQSPRYPETQIMGSGPFRFARHEKGAYWEGRRFEGYFRKGLPYLDGFKARFVKSGAVVPGIIEGHFDAEFRGRNPQERDQLLASPIRDQLVVSEGAWAGGLMLVFNTRRKPFDDMRVRRALSLAIDRWAAAASLSRISILKHVGGFTRPGSATALAEDELVRLPGFGKDIDTSRKEARRLLKEAGAQDLAFKLASPDVSEPYTAAGVYVADQWQRVGVSVRHERLEAQAHQARLLAGDFDAALVSIDDFTDEPTVQLSRLLTRAASPVGYSGHGDGKLDAMYERQRRELDPEARIRLGQDIERHAITGAYSVPLLWYQRIVVHHKRIRHSHFSPGQAVLPDLSEVWLDE